LVLVLAPATIVAAPEPARADDKIACVNAHASGQELRLAGKWREAATRFRLCAAAVCPKPITIDCTRWYEELRLATPSIVVAAQGPDGVDTVDVKLVVDGVRIADRLPTTAIALDPGEHAIRLEHAGWPAVERRMVVREREQERRVTLRFDAAPSPLEKSDAPPPPEPSRALGIGLTGGGVAAAGVAVTFAVLGRARETELADSPCGKTGTCAHDDVDVVRHRYLAAAIGGGVAVVALAIGVWQLLRPGVAPSRTARSPLGPDGVQVAF
jgi:hypothetical protein